MRKLKRRDSGRSLSLGAGTASNLHADPDLDCGAPICEFAYDGWGRRVRKTAGGVSRTYVYDREDILEERVSGGPTLRHVHGVGIDAPLATVTGGAVSYYVAVTSKK